MSGFYRFFVFDGYLSKLSTRITQENYNEQVSIILNESEQGTFNWCMASGGKDLTDVIADEVRKKNKSKFKEWAIKSNQILMNGKRKLFE